LKSVEGFPTNWTRADPAGEPAARAPLMERMLAPRAQRRAIIVPELHLAHHASIHRRSKENQLELHTPAARDPPSYHLDLAQLCPVHAVLHARHRRRPRPCHRRRHPCYRSLSRGAPDTLYRKHVLAIAARSSDDHVPVPIAIVVVTSSFKRLETCKLSLHSERYRGRGRHLIRAPRGRRLGHDVVVKHGE